MRCTGCPGCGTSPKNWRSPGNGSRGQHWSGNGFASARTRTTCSAWVCPRSRSSATSPGGWSATTTPEPAPRYRRCYGWLAQAQVDIRAVTAGRHGLTLSTELAVAREVLATADVHSPPPPTNKGGPLPAHVDAVLATVLREAVTNVLRHSRATWCHIDLTAHAAAVALRVTNDGADAGPAARRRTAEQPGGGQGLTNLAARVAGRGGRLTTSVVDGRFELTAYIPLKATESDRAGGKDPLAPGDPTHRVDKPVGGAVLDNET